jgi:protein-tyrosine phosphatase
MWRILQNLYLGDRRDAHDFDLMKHMGITHILNCALELPCWYPREFTYKHLELTDPDPEFHGTIEAFCAFIRRGRKPGSVLVHCSAGLNRSPAVILAYLCHRGKSLPEALDHLQECVEEPRGYFIEPDASFLEQLEVHFETT